MAEHKYYLTRTEHGMLELRQTRFREWRAEGSEHPHDVCAVARDEEEMRGMIERHGFGPVDWSSLDEPEPTGPAPGL